MSAAEELPEGSMCSKRVWREFAHYGCGRKAKGRLKDGSLACGVHLAAERRAAEQTAKWEAMREKARADSEESRAVVVALAAVGVEAYRGVGAVCITYAQARELVKRLGAADG